MWEVLVHWETKERVRKKVVLANVPSFRFSFQGNMRTYPRSCLRSGGTSECTLVPVFVPGEHPPNHPFGKPPFCQRPTGDPNLRNGDGNSQTNIGPAPLQKCVGDFCCINFGGFSRGFSWRIFLGTFSHKNEEKKSGEKIREKIRRLKNKNPQKIRSAMNRP